jgi:hypothetical protein
MPSVSFTFAPSGLMIVSQALKGRGYAMNGRSPFMRARGCAQSIHEPQHRIQPVDINLTSPERA